MAITLPLGDVFGRLPARPAHAVDEDHRMGDITVLMGQAHDGRPGALERLFEQLHPDLRRVARRRLDGPPPPPLADTTAAVHECYLRLLEARRLRPDDRAQFLAYAARAMRALIVDAARSRQAQRRSSAFAHAPMHVAPFAAVPGRHVTHEEEFLDVDTALTRLADVEPHVAEIAELRYFGGLDDDAIAEALGVPDRVVQRDWETARALLGIAPRE